MAILPILTAPHPFLKKKAPPVMIFDAALTQTLRDMLDTMYDAKGIGLAAVQVGIAQRMLVIFRLNKARTYAEPLSLRMRGTKQEAIQKCRHGKDLIGLPCLLWRLAIVRKSQKALPHIDQDCFANA